MQEDTVYPSVYQPPILCFVTVYGTAIQMLFVYITPKQHVLCYHHWLYRQVTIAPQNLLFLEKLLNGKTVFESEDNVLRGFGVKI